MKLGCLFPAEGCLKVLLWVFFILLLVGMCRGCA